MTICYCDIETFSDTSIKNGVYAYAEAAEVMLWAYAFDDGEVKLWNRAASEIMPTELLNAIVDPDVTFVFHNASFDVTLIRLTMGIDIPCAKVHCTMAQCYSHGTQGSLGKVAEALGIPVSLAKEKDGRRLIRLFCQPNKKIIRGEETWNRYNWQTHPEDWHKFIEYTRQDVVAMREIYKRLPKWNYPNNPTEHALWCLDQKINNRGFLVDTELALGALSAVEKEQQRLRDETMELTHGLLDSTSKRDQMLKLVLKEHGVSLPDLTNATLERRLTDENLPQGVRELIAIRLQSSKTSTSKYKALLRSVSSDNRLRGTLQYCGASRTGRFSAKLFQPQNLPSKALPPKEEIDEAIVAMKQNVADLVCTNVMKLASAAIRGCLIAPEDKKLVIADLSNIEGRVAAWLANEEWKLKAFAELDKGKGVDLYNLAYAKMFSIPVEEVNKTQRQIGKTLELACIAKGQLVTTDYGLVPIERVKTYMKVWDGLEFVEHQGVVYKGIKKVITYDGLTATPDHIVWTEKAIQIPFGECASKQIPLYTAGFSRKNIRASGNNSSRNNLERGTFRQKRTFTPLSLPTSKMLNMPQNPTDKYGQSIKRKNQRLQLLFQKTTTSANVVGQKGSGYETPVSKPKEQRIQKLWRSGYRVPFCFSNRSLCMDKTEFRATSRSRIRPYRQQRSLREGEFEIFKPNRTIFKQKIFKIKRTRLYLDQRKKPLRRIYDFKVPKIRTFILASYRKSFSGSFREKKKLETYKSSITYTRVYDILNCGPRNRYVVSDVLVHNCGYGGSVGAFITFANGFNMDLDQLAIRARHTIPDDIFREASKMYNWAKSKDRTYGLSESTYLVCESLKLMWRRANPNIQAYWFEIENAVKKAINLKDGVVICGKVSVIKQGAWLKIRLPSGRFLSYASPRLQDNKISYLGVSQYTRKWERIETYGGKIYENLCQAIARDVMTANMPLIEDSGYSIVLTVHDEIITETLDYEIYNANDLAKLLSSTPSWGEGLPLNAKGFETYRYRKD